MPAGMLSDTTTEQNMGKGIRCNSYSEVVIEGVRRKATSINHPLRTINEWNKLSTDCVTASSVNMFKNNVETYLRKAGYTRVTHI